MTRDEAIILMVESNFQRSQILPSEKAFAYKMRLEAMKRQGQRTDLTSVPVAQKSKTAREELGEQVGESQDQIRRYIRLTHLVSELRDYVDEGQIKMRACGGAFLFGRGLPASRSRRNRPEPSHTFPCTDHSDAPILHGRQAHAGGDIRHYERRKTQPARENRPAWRQGAQPDSEEYPRKPNGGLCGQGTGALQSFFSSAGRA